MKLAFVCNDRGYLAANQIGRERRQAINPVFGKAEFDRDVAALDEPGSVEALTERGDPVGNTRRRRIVEKPNDRHRLLRACRKRPRGGAAKQCDELAAANHSITSSALARSVAGTSTPIARAVARLMTNSNLVARATGKSAGFSPLRIRPA